MTRQADLQQFLGRHGWNGAQVEPVAGDASSRRYDRLSHVEKGVAVLMDAPPASGEDVRPFCNLAEHLCTLGLSAPRVLASDANQGFLLLEDLGDDLFARLIEQDQGCETALYVAAVDALLELHRHPPPADLAPFGPDEMAAAVDVTMTWYAAGCGTRVERTATEQISALVLQHLNSLPTGKPVLALRDFHAENLLWLPERRGAARVGLLDFQDAFAGHPAYDLVSLIEDARRDVSEATRTATLSHFVEAGDHTFDNVERACATLGAQRNLRILGVFARLSMHFGKPQYIDLIPRVWGHLQRDLAHPALSDLALFVRQAVPEPTPERLQRIKDRCRTDPTP